MPKADVAGGLSDVVARTLDEVCATARTALGDRLHAIVLYGSAAEGRLRPASDVNIVFVLDRFDASAMDALNEPLQLAAAAIALSPMFLLTDEIPSATAAFAVKFDDISRRRRVLYGPDPFANLTVPRERLVVRLQQVTLNLALRLRARYALRSMLQDETVRAVSDAAGPLRSAAASLLALEGTHAASPKAALAAVAASIGDAAISDAVARVSDARERRALPEGSAAPILTALADLAARMHARACRLS